MEITPLQIDKQSKTIDASIASIENSKVPYLSERNAFDPLLCTKQLIRGSRFGSLATLNPDGAPFASLVNVAAATDGTPIILISRLALHTQNITGDKRVSLLLTQSTTIPNSDDPSAQPRVSISAHAVITTDMNDRRRFLTHHPRANSYAGFTDFAFYRLIPTHFHLVAGFGQIHSLSPHEVLSEHTVASEIAQVEEDVIAHLNKDHQNALALYATMLAGAPTGDWLAVGIDPDGIDLFSNNATARVLFEAPLEGASQIRVALVKLLTKTRKKKLELGRIASGA